MKTTLRLAVAAGLTLAGVAAGLATGGAASAQPADLGVATMSSPYIPGVWHVPADVLLTIGPDGTHYVGPRGSMFNGPTDRVDARVDAWWEEQLAAGLMPEQADRALAELNRS